METPEKPPITVEEAQRIAALAHLALSPEELARLTGDLGRILGYVRQLEEVDVAGVAPTTQVSLMREALREDEPGASFTHELALREAPRASEGGFAVPAFVDEG